MDVNLALAVIAAECVESAAEHGKQPYFWPMVELVGFLISECGTADPTESPALAAIQAEPDLARERAREIDAAVTEIRTVGAARAEAHRLAWEAAQKTAS